MNMLSRPHPALVPTLTEVIEVGGDDQPPSASAMPGTATEVLPVQAMVPDGGAVQEGQLVQRVLTDVQRQIDSMLEFRLREALAPVLARHSEAIVRDPEVTVNGHNATRSAKAQFTYTYTVQANDPLGPAFIEISGQDAAGNLGAGQSSSVFTVVPPSPHVPLIAWPLAASLAAASLVFKRRQRG